MLLPRKNLIATVLIALIVLSGMIANGQIRAGAPSPKDANDLIFCHIRDTGRAREGLGSSRLSMAVWNNGQMVVGAVRANGIEYLAATLGPEELTLLRSRLKDIDTAQGDQLHLPPDAAHT